MLCVSVKPKLFRRTELALALTFTVFCAAACGAPLVSEEDAGSRDASIRDAGPGDSGPDERDGGRDSGALLVDGSMTDASTNDASTNDASTNDASMNDASMNDASMTDASMADASTSDAGDAALDGGPRRGPPPIDLGTTTDLASAAAYVLIGKAGVTNTTGSMITGGHVGVSPAASTAITGFSLILDSTTVFATSASVIPPARVYAADYAAPTPANLTSAILDMEMGYTDGASRTTPDFLNLATGNVGGLTLEPGLYTWGTTVTIPADVTIEGGVDDTWIFQITGDLDVSAGMNVILAGGAQAQNIFWVVAGQVTIHANAHFEGIILSQTAITLQTNASFRGRALAQTLVAIDDNMITAP